MRGDERRALQEVTEEYLYLLGLLKAVERPDTKTANNLEATYLLRLYASFESLLRSRLEIDDRENGRLTNMIQRLTGESVGYDPTDDGRSITWWRLLSRDRNRLAHGRTLQPAIGITRTRGLMEEYLAILKV